MHDTLMQNTLRYLYIITKAFPANHLGQRAIINGEILMNIFEAGMLICFGAAWPVNIYKSITSRTTKGKSLGFLIIILAGYISGIINKLLFDRDIVMILYFINFFMVFADIILYTINKKRENREKDKC